MEQDKSLIETNQEDTLLNNINYFKYIFKKTEKISCAVFYILRNQTNNVSEDTLTTDLKKSAKSLLDISLLSLRATQREIPKTTGDLRFEVLSFESSLRLAHAGGVITNETLAVFLNETDTVLRTLKQYSDDSNDQARINTGTGRVYSMSKSARIEGKRDQSRSISTSEPKLPRKDRILTVLKDKTEASIKDITEIVTDCSEKTIQRDLNELIKDSIVKREGERRWSKYSLI